MILLTCCRLEATCQLKQNPRLGRVTYSSLPNISEADGFSRISCYCGSCTFNFLSWPSRHSPFLNTPSRYHDSDCPQRLSIFEPAIVYTHARTHNLAHQSCCHLSAVHAAKLLFYRFLSPTQPDIPFQQERCALSYLQRPLSLFFL